MRKSLLENTWIPRETGEQAGGLFARDTASAIAAAGAHAASALVERVLDRSSLELGRRAQLVLTGSDAPKLQAVLPEPCLIEPDLVMKGLALVAMEWQ